MFNFELQILFVFFIFANMLSLPYERDMHQGFKWFVGKVMVCQKYIRNKVSPAEHDKDNASHLLS